MSESVAEQALAGEHDSPNLPGEIVAERAAEAASELGFLAVAVAVGRGRGCSIPLADRQEKLLPKESFGGR